MATEANTEEKILAAAEEIFHTKGYDGSRMQEIAEHAGINKGLLHYYFKTKDKLFEAIFSVALNRMVTKIQAILGLEIPLEKKIGMIIDQYLAMLAKNPNLPRFVLNELNKNPDEFVKKHISNEAKAIFNQFVQSVQKEADQQKIKPIDARHLFINMMSLMIFPFIGRPMLQRVLGVEGNEYAALMAERKVQIKEFIHNALRV